MEADFGGENRSTRWQELSFAIVGLGLIGGSYAKALRKLGVKQIIGVERDEATLQEAKQQGIIDIGMANPDARLKEANVIICAIYPDAIVGFIAANVDYFNEKVLLTDVAGIKNDMISRGQALLKDGMEFISGHPMAGRQGSGLGMSDAHIFQNANYIIVPEKHNTQAAVSWLEQFALALGCKHTVQVTPAQHDATIAYTSNLPHVTAVALMDSASFDDKTKYFVAGSFRDGTRVADINPELWCNLFLANREKVADEIDKYMEQLVLWRDALRSDDGRFALKSLQTVFETGTTESEKPMTYEQRRDVYIQRLKKAYSAWVEQAKASKGVSYNAFPKFVAPKCDEDLLEDPAVRDELLARRGYAKEIRNRYASAVPDYGEDNVRAAGQAGTHSVQHPVIESGRTREQSDRNVEH